LATRAREGLGFKADVGYGCNSKGSQIP